MAVSVSKLQGYTLDEYLDAWERDGQTIPSGSRAFPAFDEIEGAAAHPDALDRLFSGPQSAFIRTWEALFAARWRDGINDLNDTPAGDANWQPAPIALVDDVAGRIFDKNAVVQQRLRFKDTIIAQRTANDFNNYIEAKFVLDSAEAGNVSFTFKWKAVTASGAIPTAWEVPIVVVFPVDNSASKSVYTVKFDMATPYQIGDMIIGDFYRNTANDTVAGEVGIVKARLI